MSNPRTTASDGLPRPSGRRGSHPAATPVPLLMRRQQALSWKTRFLAQLAVAAALLAAWQYLPKVHWLSHRYKWIDPFFISSPAKVAVRIKELATGDGAGRVKVWPYLWATVETAILGVLIGLAAGALAGLFFSNSRRVSSVIRPFIVLANTVPAITLIPIFIIIFGATNSTTTVSVAFIVFFLTFFSAFEGGSSVPQSMIENAALLGASPLGVMWTIRLPQVLVWTFAIIPNAVAFGVIVAITSGLFTGINGMGTLLQQYLAATDATGTFAVIVTMSAVALILYIIATQLKKVFLRWDDRG